MGRTIPERPALLAEAQKLAILHVGETASMRVAVPEETEAHVQAVLLRAARRRVLFEDDINEVRQYGYLQAL